MNTIEQEEAAGVPKDAENGDSVPRRRRYGAPVRQLSIAQPEGQQLVLTTCQVPRKHQF
ncbi:hypothetical protein BRADI_5g12914v3 [Brachypodium distachyon]|uniref:Uncharacterized protein n=1 Tax=Brachypodium distachyon TaxID=15368 RepID=A0A0Q3E5F4_BRADI|nr:hypothetical protein BRADI_5g12914v3 [Brachypodium distachyon]KQJ83080.1 hypothetical protein BRADI_5g12914v3 [Brachypodium distachyon]